MAVLISNPDKDYLLVISQKDLFDLAKDVEGIPILFIEEKRISKKDLDILRDSDKILAYFYCCIRDKDGNPCDKDSYRADLISKQLQELGKCKLQLDIGEAIGGQKARTREDAMRRLVDRWLKTNLIEDYFFNNGYIRIKNHEGRCGNCHEYLVKDARYCEYCGTERGKGKFEPFYNMHTGALYGPSMRVKRKCGTCGYMLIKPLFGARPPEIYCPKCGRKDTMETLKTYTFDYIFQPYDGWESPYEDCNRPKLLTEKQVDDLLNMRSDHLVFGYDPDVCEKAEKAGIFVPIDMSDPHSYNEADSERLKLSSSILSITDEKILDNMPCPHCNGERIAIKDIRCEEDKKARHKYRCLCCGEEFDD